MKPVASLSHGAAIDIMLDFKTLLHPTDFSRHADHACELAFSVARDRQARLIVLYVGPRDALVFGDQSSPPVEGDPQAELKRRFRQIEQRAGSLKVECVWREGDPATEIVALAKEQSVDLIVMGTHGRGGLSKLLMGSVASEVASSAPCAVVTFRDPS